MKVLIGLIALVTVSAKACFKRSGTHDTVVKETGALPACIQHKIDSIKGQPQWNPPAQVEEYTYKGKTVLFIQRRLLRSV